MSQKRLREHGDSFTRTRERGYTLHAPSKLRVICIYLPHQDQDELLSLPPPASRMSHLHRAMIARGKWTSGDSTV